MANRISIKCEKCGNGTKKSRKYKGKFLCFNCYQKSVKSIIGISPNLGYSIEQSLNKVYEHTF